ncbi:hypothetical protein EON63_05920 [archaeon]|nr:MAG: hypothetical protein EON63_05920 [archaeon]
MYLLYHCLGVVVIILLSRPVVGQENGDTVNNHVPHAIHNPHHHRAGHRPPHQPNPSQQDVHYRHTYNVSSPHFKAIANQTYARVLPCLTSAWMLQGQHMDWQFPDDAEEHFEEIKKRTACYRVQPVHEYAGYEGPWMENQFINKYINKPLGMCYLCTLHNVCVYINSPCACYIHTHKHFLKHTYIFIHIDIHTY